MTAHTTTTISSPPYGITPTETFDIQSSTIKQIEWFDTSPEALNVPCMRVRFHSGGNYRFSGVDRDTFNMFSKAESAGKFFAAVIKGKYPSVKEVAQ